MADPTNDIDGLLNHFATCGPLDNGYWRKKHAALTALVAERDELKQRVSDPKNAADGYRLYRGRCKELSEAACVADPSLKLVRGHYYCPIWNSDEPHWWTVWEDGTVHDPTREQFPSRGCGVYTPFDGIVSCAECGKEVAEEDTSTYGNYAFCCDWCHGRFVGVF